MSPEEITKAFTALMSGLDNSNAEFKSYYVDLIEKAANMDDLSLLRAAEVAERFEKDFKMFCDNFPFSSVSYFNKGDIKKNALQLAKLDRDARRSVLLEVAKHVRNSHFGF